jgi:four helix bundle protein
MKGKTILQEKSFAYALRIIKLNRLLNQKNEFVISRQLMRCGTSVSAGIEEAGGSTTKREFARKLRTAYRDAVESRYWLSLLKDSGTISPKEGEALLHGCDELLKMLGRSLATIRRNMEKGIQK